MLIWMHQTDQLFPKDAPKTSFSLALPALNLLKITYLLPMIHKIADENQISIINQHKFSQRVPMHWSFDDAVKMA